MGVRVGAGNWSRGHEGREDPTTRPKTLSKCPGFCEPHPWWNITGQVLVIQLTKWTALERLTDYMAWADKLYQNYELRCDLSSHTAQIHQIVSNLAQISRAGVKIEQIRG